MAANALPRSLFRTRRRFTICFVIAAVAFAFVNGVLRHHGDAERYRLFLAAGRLPRPNWPTYWVEPYESLYNWRSIIPGDFRPIYEASRGRRLSRDHKMYTPGELTEHKASFVYAPITALLATPLTYFDEMRTAADWVSFVNHLLWVIGLVLIFKIAAYRRPLLFGEYLLLTFGYLAFYPMAKALSLTQAGVWIFFLLAVSTLLFQRQRFVASGITLAVAVCIKPHLVLAVVLLIAAGGMSRRFLVAAAASVLGIAGVSVLYAGWRNIHDYVFETLATLSNGYAFFANQSFNGLLMRLFTDVDPMVFNLAPRVEWITQVGRVCGLILLAVAWALCWARGRQMSHDANVLRYVLAISACTIASPVAWIHHFTALFVPVVVVVNYLARNPEARRIWIELGLFVSFCLMSFFLETGHLKSGWLVLLSSVQYYGVLLLLAVMAGVVLQAETEPQGTRIS